MAAQGIANDATAKRPVHVRRRFGGAGMGGHRLEIRGSGKKKRAGIATGPCCVI
jgi:hypothetical protein